MKDRDQLKTIALLSVYRIFCAILTRNYEYPDQHWQGPQVAHHLHYNYGYLTWEWTMHEPIRNPFYPFILSLSYYVVDLLNLTSLHPCAPRFLVQVPLAIIADFYLLKILTNIYGKISILMLVAIFGNWYYASTMVRTYFNSFETVAAIIGMYYWLKSGTIGINNRQDLICRVIAIISYVSRPTSIMIWAIVWPYQLIKIAIIYNPISKKSFFFILKNIITIVVMVLSSLIVGSLYNWRWTLTELNFIKYNFVEKWSQLYGQQPGYFYFLLSVPFIANTALICVGLVLLKTFSKQRKNQLEQPFQKNIKAKKQKLQMLIVISLIYLVISSFSVHKQHRFIFPIIPFILIISVQCLEKSKSQYIVMGINISKQIIRGIIIFTILLNIFLFLQFNFYGKSDGYSAWSYISEKIDMNKMEINQTSVIIMGQSHFIPPPYSSLHKNIKYKIPDSSAIKMSKNESELQLLSRNPQQLFNILTDNGQLQPTFVIAQGKYLQYTAHVLGQRKYLETIHWRHCTVFQEIAFGYDSISVFEKG